jgi:malonyl-CoA O-methyltransferase
MEKHIERFGSAARSYEDAGELQRFVAARLAEGIYAPQKDKFAVLEIGCGTGFLTRHLHQKFSGAATYIITDAAPEMVDSCKSAFARAAANIRFETMDGQKITLPAQSVDVIASSMTIQWFDDPTKSLLDMQRLLKPGGTINYATIGSDNFTEWREHLEHCGLDFGMRPQPESLPGQFRQEFIPRNYQSGRGFLEMLKATGANTPKPDYKRPSPRDFYKAVDSFDGDVTWHVVYGRLPALAA